jgi:hypothetical protein
VLNKYIVAGALIAAASGTLAAREQVPRNPTPRETAPPVPGEQGRPVTPTNPQASTSQTTTVIGCVYQEKDVPGRAPNVAERAGVLEDYILAEVSGRATAGGGTAGATGTSGSGSAGATGTAGTGTGPMYKLEFADDDKLKTLVGKRVEVMGRIDAEPGDAVAPPAGARTTPTDKVIGRDRVNLSEFEVTSIKEVAGTCPASPGAR